MSYTLVSLWSEVRKRLEAAGVDSPVLDARLLLEAGAGVARLEIVTDPRRTLGDAQADAVLGLCARREAREPISHILGRKSFWTLDLIVGRDVLTPRPETEFVVEAALTAIPIDVPTRILDLGVGSGAILLALLSERPLATGVGVDVSAAALAVAQANAAQLGLAARVSLTQGEWDVRLDGEFDVLVSNPPYIASQDIAGLAPEVALFEPRLALDGGPDGLDAYRALFKAAPRHLAVGGVFAFELGQGQAQPVKTLAGAAGFEACGIRTDLNRIERVVWGRWRGA